MKAKYKKLIPIGLILLILWQILAIIDETMLLRDLGEVIWFQSYKLSPSKKLQTLIETCNKYGQAELQFRYSVFFICISVICLSIYFINYIKKKKKTKSGV